jgi:hypothetical protein
VEGVTHGPEGAVGKALDGADDEFDRALEEALLLELVGNEFERTYDVLVEFPLWIEVVD